MPVCPARGGGGGVGVHNNRHPRRAPPAYLDLRNSSDRKSEFWRAPGVDSVRKKVTLVLGQVRACVVACRAACAAPGVVAGAIQEDPDDACIQTHAELISRIAEHVRVGESVRCVCAQEQLKDSFRDPAAAVSPW